MCSYNATKYVNFYETWHVACLINWANLSRLRLKPRYSGQNHPILLMLMSYSLHIPDISRCSFVHARRILRHINQILQSPEKYVWIRPEQPLNYRSWHCQLDELTFIQTRTSFWCPFCRQDKLPFFSCVVVPPFLRTKTCNTELCCLHLLLYLYWIGWGL